MPALLFTVFFLLRRLILVLTLIYLPFYGNFQISINIMVSFVMLTYTIKYRPYYEPIMNIQEIVNETFVWLSSYWMLFFTDWIPDDLNHKGTNVKNSLGISMLALLGIFLASNLVVIGYALVVETKFYLKKVKAERIKKKIEEEIRKREKELEE